MRLSVSFPVNITLNRDSGVDYFAFAESSNNYVNNTNQSNVNDKKDLNVRRDSIFGCRVMVAAHCPFLYELQYSQREKVSSVDRLQPAGYSLSAFSLSKNYRIDLPNFPRRNLSASFFFLI